jgi:protein SCO1
VNPRILFAVALVGLCALGAVVGVTLAARDGGAGGDQGLELAGGWAGAVRPPGIPPADFRLRDQDGRSVSLSDYRGRPVVLSFVYSTCEDTCPAQVQSIRGALDDLGRDVPVLAVSVDPANDTPARAKRFLVAQRMTGRMEFLLGTRAQLTPIWREYAIRPQGEDFDHSAYVLLIDAQGRQRIAHPVDKLTSDGLVHDLRKLGREPAGVATAPGQAVAAASASADSAASARSSAAR